MKLLAASLLLCLLLYTKSARADWPRPGAQVTELQAQNERLLRKLGKAEKRIVRLKRQKRRLERDARHRWQPSVMHAIRLAATIWRVPQSELVSVGSCESQLYPYARNGIYRGVFQEGPMFERGPFRSFSVFDPYANVFTAAFTVAREGWGQWACKP